MWDYYLGYCEGAFAERYIGDAQLLLAKAGAPMTRTEAAPAETPKARAARDLEKRRA